MTATASVAVLLLVTVSGVEALTLAVSAFLIDFACPSIWAFNQDVGGRYVSAAAGWGNMWGNFGAALSPVLLAAVSRSFGWPAIFLACAAAFLLACGCGLLLNANRPLAGRSSSKLDDVNNNLVEIRA